MIKNKEPLVEVIVLNTNGKKNVLGCLESLKKVSYENLRVNVVDQNSSDGSPEIIEKKYPWVNLVRNKVNNGFVGGNNQILRKSKAKYCILLNDDTEQDSKWISELVKIAEKDENIAALQPKILALKEKEMFEYAGAGGAYLDLYGTPLCRGRVFFDMEKDVGQYDDIRKVFWCSGVAMFLRTSVLRKIGYLDDFFFIYSEEMDLGWRMNLAGYKQYYVPSSVIYHLGSATMGGDKARLRGDQSSGFKVYLLHRNIWITLLKNYSIKTWWKIVPVKIVLELMAFARFLFDQPVRSLAIARANFWVVFHPGFILKRHRKISKLRKVPDKKIMDSLIRRSVSLDYFLLKRRKFDDYIRFIKDFDKFDYDPS